MGSRGMRRMRAALHRTKSWLPIRHDNSRMETTTDACMNCGGIIGPFVGGHCEWCQPFEHLQFYESDGRGLTIRMQIFDMNGAVIDTWVMDHARLEYRAKEVVVLSEPLLVKNNTGRTWISEKQVLKVEGLPEQHFGTKIQCFDQRDQIICRPGETMEWSWETGVVGALID